MAKIGSAIVEILTKGLTQVQAELQSLKSAAMAASAPVVFVVELTGVGEVEKKIAKVAKTPRAKIEVDVAINEGFKGELNTLKNQVNKFNSTGIQVNVQSSGMEKLQSQLTDFAAKFEKIRSAVITNPVTIALNVSDQASSAVKAIMGDLARVPSEKKIAFVGERLSELDSKIIDLNKQLAATPGDKSIQIQLQVASNARAELRKELADLKVGVKVDAAAAKEQTKTLFDGLRSQFANSQIMIDIGVVDQASAYIKEIFGQIRNLPKEQKIAVLLDQRAQLQSQLAQLRGELAQFPNDKKIRVEVIATSKAIDEVNSALNQTNKISLDGIRGLQRMSSVLLQIGAVGGTAFAGVVAGLVKFGSAADPRAWSELQGKIAQLSVNIGTIFIPIIDKVSAVIERVLNWFRALTDAQKQQIEKWIEIVGVVGLGVLVIGTLGSVLTKAAIAVKVLGAAFEFLGFKIAIASGGLIPLVGLVAGVIAAMAGFGAVTGQVSNVGSLFASLAELGKKLAAVAVQIGAVFMQAFAVIAPVIEGVIAVVSGLISALSAVPTPIIEIGVALALMWKAMAGSGLGATLTALASVLLIVDAVADSLGTLPGILAALTAAVVVFGVAWQAALGPIGWLITGIGLLIGLVGVFNKKKEEAVKLERFTPKAQEIKVSFVDFTEAFKQNQIDANKLMTPAEKAQLEVLGKIEKNTLPKKPPMGEPGNDDR